MSILLGPDAAVGTNAHGARTRDTIMSPAEKRRMSNPALGQPGVIEVEMHEAASAAAQEVVAVHDGLQRDFVKLCDGACSVICCRMSPSQKGRMVLLMRRLQPDLCTLAIGDGANDVNMIQSANIGIGVRGKEGMQAVLASDYAITRFRFLLPLLLVHGHWNYRRQSKTILYVTQTCATLAMP
jgi:magnesium-transporting ATPase (P-type)